MVPQGDKIEYLVISATEKGYQTGATLLATLQHWDRTDSSLHGVFLNLFYG